MFRVTQGKDSDSPDSSPDYNAADAGHVRSMTVNAVAFYILSALVVVGAVAAVALRSLQHAGFGLVGFTSAVGILSIASGAYATGTLEFVIPAAAIMLVAVALRKTPYWAMTEPKPPSGRAMLAGLGVAIAFAALLFSAFAIGSGGWHTGSGAAKLITLLHLRAPYAFVIALLTVVAGIGGALMIARAGSDERHLDRALEERRLREERARRRREDREAARRQRGPAAEEAGG